MLKNAKIGESMDTTSQINMPVGVTPMSRAIYDLHMLVFWICVAIAVVVFGVMIYALIRHRKSAGHQAAHFHEHTVVEIIWTIIPFLILIAIAVPATKTLINLNDESDSALTVKITGYQWKWKYEYLDQGISFMSNLSTPQDEIENVTPKNEWYLLEVDHPLVLPINEKIRFLITSNDVIHSWWVPALGIKRDAIPGFIHESWARIEKPGMYRGQCAELCGTNHGFMPIVVIAMTQPDFDAWVKQQQKLEKENASAVGGYTPKKMNKEELMQLGKNVFEENCAVCHKVDGSGMPPAFPALNHDKVVNGPLADQIKTVLYGRPGTAMQAWGKVLNDQDIAAAITYTRNAWGNHTGDVVEPEQIKAARDKNQ
jgi:cytochrome c oxidase subunit II